MDKGSTLREKYGNERGWKMSLRYDEANKGEVLEYCELAG